jgi:hypothetical protein
VITIDPLPPLLPKPPMPALKLTVYAGIPTFVPVAMLPPPPPPPAPIPLPPTVQQASAGAVARDGDLGPIDHHHQPRASESTHGSTECERDRAAAANAREV